MRPQYKKKTMFCLMIFLTVAISLMGIGTANAWHAEGHIYCDANENGVIDSTDLPMENVGVTVKNIADSFTSTDFTAVDGSYDIGLLDTPDSYVETLDASTLPPDATYVIPSSGQNLFQTTNTAVNVQDWLINSSSCRQVAGCRVTGGGNATAGINPSGGWDGTLAEGKDNSHKTNGIVDRYTFGGQAGANTAEPPQPKGEWTHHQQSGPDGSFVFHAGTASAPPGTEIDRIVCSDVGYCVPARPAPDKQIDFAGVGTFKNIKDPSPALANVVLGVTYHWFEVHIEDLGEPGKGKKGDLRPGSSACPLAGSGTDAFAATPVFSNANCGCPDYYRIRIYQGVIPVFDTSTGEITNMDKTHVIYEVSGYLDGGNFQIHPPTGFDLK
jgi:hypothetical protein